MEMLEAFTSKEWYQQLQSNDPALTNLDLTYQKFPSLESFVHIFLLIQKHSWIKRLDFEGQPRIPLYMGRE